MDTIKHLLHRRDHSEPKEVRLIKAYVQEHFKSSVAVTVQSQAIVIGASNAALAGTLRLHSHQLAELCETKKRLIIRISG